MPRFCGRRCAGGVQPAPPWHPDARRGRGGAALAGLVVGTGVSSPGGQRGGPGAGCLRAQARRLGSSSGILPAPPPDLLRGPEVRGAGTPALYCSTASTIRSCEAPEIAGAVDRCRVASSAQMEELIAAVATIGRTQGPRLKALYGCMYYGMLRPSEAASLLLDECTLPGRGWGLLEFSEISSAAGRARTEHLSTVTSSCATARHGPVISENRPRIITGIH